jgi:hypothetical protein
MILNWSKSSRYANDVWEAQGIDGGTYRIFFEGIRGTYIDGVRQMVVVAQYIAHMDCEVYVCATLALAKEALEALERESIKQALSIA